MDQFEEEALMNDMTVKVTILTTPSKAALARNILNSDPIEKLSKYLINLEHPDQIMVTLSTLYQQPSLLNASLQD